MARVTHYIPARNGIHACANNCIAATSFTSPSPVSADCRRRSKDTEGSKKQDGKKLQAGQVPQG